MECYFTILEVSQKQSYIFSDNELKNNIISSDLIFFITSSEFLEGFDGLYQRTENLVYEGGGHIIVTYKEKEEADKLARAVSQYILENFELLELFIKTVEYKGSPVETRNILIEELEKKKARRRSSFKQGLFGIEYLDIEDKHCGKAENEKLKKDISDKLSELEKEWIKPYEQVRAFRDLGGRKNESNFIAVIHIDGNQMGKRVGALDSENTGMNLKDYRNIRQKFSSQIEEAFKDSYRNMLEIVKHQIETGILNDLDLETKDKKNFPVRKIIIAGDDVCFVTEGRIGIECAAAFLKELWKKKNKIDKKNYPACAGVAIVHEKYPFYRAYELAEELCSNAKKMVSNRNTDEMGSGSVIDWHIELGELFGSVGEIRNQYCSSDGEELQGRPYFVCEDNLKGELHSYDQWKDLVQRFKSSKEASAKGKLKQYFQILKEGRISADNFVKGKLLMDVDEGERICLFDALEVMDYFISFEEVQL